VALLLSLDTTAVEDIIAEMIENGWVKAKIDRPRQLIKFETNELYNDKLTQSGHLIYNVINSVEECVDLIEREKLKGY